MADLPLPCCPKRPAASYGACLRPGETGTTARSISSPSGKLPGTEQRGARAMSDHVCYHAAGAWTDDEAFRFTSGGQLEARWQKH